MEEHNLSCWRGDNGQDFIMFLRGGNAAQLRCGGAAAHAAKRVSKLAGEKCRRRRGVEVPQTTSFSKWAETSRKRFVGYNAARKLLSPSRSEAG